MNAAALLALIAELYSQVLGLREKNRKLQERLEPRQAEAEAKSDG
jgi:hypothetical protein